MQQFLHTRTRLKINAFNLDSAFMINVKIFNFNPLQENTYILYNEALSSMIIDPGCYFDHERDEIVNFIEKTGLKPTQLVNTHCHLDHVFGNRFIHERYGLELHIHEGEKKVLDLAPASGLMWNMPFDNYAGPIHFIDPSNKLMLGEDEIEVLFTPGHSPASISLYSASNGFLVAGDVLFRESVGRTDLPGGDPDVLVNSILTQFYVLPDKTVVYSGHGSPTTIGHEKKFNPFVKA